MSAAPAHDALMANSAGYREFYAEEQASGYSDVELVKGFADWFLICLTDAPDFVGRTADQYRAEWERWNS